MACKHLFQLRIRGAIFGIFFLILLHEFHFFFVLCLHSLLYRATKFLKICLLLHLDLPLLLGIISLSAILSERFVEELIIRLLRLCDLPLGALTINQSVLSELQRFVKKLVPFLKELELACCAVLLFLLTSLFLKLPDLLVGESKRG